MVIIVSHGHFIQKNITQRWAATHSSAQTKPYAPRRFPDCKPTVFQTSASTWKTRRLCNNGCARTVLERTAFDAVRIIDYEDIFNNPA